MIPRLPRQIGLTLALVLALQIPASAQAGSTFATAFGGTFIDSSGNTGPVAGAFYLESFANQDGSLAATGTALYSLCVAGVDPKNCLASFSRTVVLPVTASEASCDQLDLTLGGIEVIEPPFTIDFTSTLLVISGSSRTSEAILCGLSKRLAGAGQQGNLVPLMNRLIDP